METNRSSHVCNQRHRPSQRVQTFLLCLPPAEGPLEATHISTAPHVEEQQQSSSITALTEELCACLSLASYSNCSGCLPLLYSSPQLSPAASFLQESLQNSQLFCHQIHKKPKNLGNNNTNTAVFLGTVLFSQIHATKR